MQTFKDALLASPMLLVFSAVVIMILTPEQSQFYLTSVVICLILILASMLIIAFTVSSACRDDKLWLSAAAICTIVVCQLGLAWLVLYDAFVIALADQFAASFMIALSKLLIIAMMTVCAVTVGLVVHRVQNHQLDTRRRY